jgi:hypothetical protein
MMSVNLQFQVRITLSDALSQTARRDPKDPELSALIYILTKHNATLSCQYDAFAGYVSRAEAEGTEKYPLYAWTKDTIEDPVKKAKYIKAFTLYVNDQEVYDQNKADPLEADLKPLLESKLIERLTKHDTNPANNPQPPKKFRAQ